MPFKMAYTNYLVEEQRKLREKGAIIRAESIRTQIKSVDTFCGLAESELRQQAHGEAGMIQSKIREAMARIAHHLDEPGHVSSDAVAELRSMFATVETRVQRIEAALSPRI
jgi:hypothetical protein